MKTITLEEHFLTKSFVKATHAFWDHAPRQMLEMQPKLLDLGAGRIAAMDEGGVDLQVLSSVPMGFDELDAETASSVAKDVNDELAEAVKRNPGRFGGFAMLGMKNPESAAAELERCVTRLGFHGALVDGTVGGAFLDAPRFLPVFETAAKLGVPIYLHPAPPPEPVMKAYYSGLPGELGQMLSIAGWGWHAETALHTLRLIVAGVFDKVPELQLIIGHMGEMLPMALTRSSAVLSGAAKLKQTVAEYFNTNIHVTTSGYFSLPPLKCALEVVGIERMMYSVDYPFSANTRGKSFLEEVGGVLKADEMEMLTHGNAEKVLKL